MDKTNRRPFQYGYSQEIRQMPTKPTESKPSAKPLEEKKKPAVEDDPVKQGAPEEEAALAAAQAEVDRLRGLLADTGVDPDAKGRPIGTRRLKGGAVVNDRVVWVKPIPDNPDSISAFQKFCIKNERGYQITPLAEDEDWPTWEPFPYPRSNVSAGVPGAGPIKGAF